MESITSILNWSFAHFGQLTTLIVVLFVSIQEIKIIFFPQKVHTPSDSIFFKPFYRFASLFKKSIAKRLLNKKILKELKVSVVPFSRRLSFDEFLKAYQSMILKGEVLTKSVEKQINERKQRFIFVGDGGSGKTLTAYKMIDILQDEAYIPVIYKGTFDKDEILASSISLETHTVKLIENIFYKKFIFIFDNFDMETFSEASDICKSEFPESLFILTTRNASLNSDYNFNEVDKERLLTSFLLGHKKIETTFSIPLYLAILKEFAFKDYKTKNEIIEKYIEKQNLSLKKELHINDAKEEDFYQLLEYVYKATALLSKKSIELKNDENFKDNISKALKEFDPENRFEFIYENLGLNELEFFNELEKSSILYEDKDVFYFVHDIMAEYFQSLVASDMLENSENHNKETLNFILTLDKLNKKANEKLGHVYEKEEAYQKAVDCYYKSDSYLKIEEIYLLNKVELSASNWFSLAFLLNQYKLYDKAIEAYQKAIEINPQYADAYSNMGNIYHDKQEYNKAIEAYQKAIDINPQHPNAYSNMGNTYAAKQEYDKALEAYQKAIDINPQHPNAYYNVGIAYAAKQEYDKALEAYQKAIEINPQYADAYSNMGNIYHDKQEYNKAIEAYQKAIDINPQHPNAYSNMGNTYAAKQEYDKALEAYQKAIDINPQHPNAYYNVGIAYYHKQEYDEAIIAYQKAISINENYIKAYQGLISLYQNLKQPQDVQFYQQALDKVIEKMKENEKR